MSGYIDTYSIGDGIAERLRASRLRLAERRGIALGGPAPQRAARRTPDRWHRRWQAEHTGDLAHLGATRAWTRTGAFILHARRCQAATS